MLMVDRPASTGAVGFRLSRHWNNSQFDWNRCSLALTLNLVRVGVIESVLVHHGAEGC